MLEDGSEYCILKAAKNIGKIKFSMYKGKSVAENFPSDVCFHMAPEFPKIIMIADNIGNVSSMPLISSRIKRFIIKKS